MLYPIEKSIIYRSPIAWTVEKKLECVKENYLDSYLHEHFISFLTEYISLYLQVIGKLVNILYFFKIDSHYSYK